MSKIIRGNHLKDFYKGEDTAESISVVFPYPPFYTLKNIM